MPEPITLAVVGGLALSEGVKFLYAQATELLKSWRARREAKRAATHGASAPSGPEAALPTLAQPPADLLDGELDTARLPDEQVLASVESELESVKKKLARYTHPSDPEDVDPEDAQFLAQLDELRRLVESIYGQRITFAREKEREPSGTVIDVTMSLENIRASEMVGVEGAEQAGAGSTTRVALDAKDVDNSVVKGVSFGRRPAPSTRPGRQPEGG